MACFTVKLKHGVRSKSLWITVFANVKVIVTHQKTAEKYLSPRRLKHVQQQSFENKTNYEEDMPPPEESSAGQQVLTTPVLSLTSNFPVPSPKKVSSDRVTNWEILDNSGRTTSLAPVSNIVQNQFVQQPLAQLWGKTVLRYF